MSDSELRKFFEFDESDLNANRLGKLSPKQKSKLDTDEKGSNQIFIGAGIVFILIGLTLVYFLAGPSVFKLFYGTRINSGDVLAIILGGGLPALLFGFFGLGAFRLSRSKLDNTVKSVQGKVNFVIVEKQVPTSTSSVSSFRTVKELQLRVGKIGFDNVDEELHNIIEEGDIYNFYYTKDTQQILSCEFISKGK